jgi:hypothetical protein
MNGTEVHPIGAEPDRLALETQVRRILESSTFQNSPLLKLFLEFVTTEAFAGRSDGISEYAIATRVLGRKDDFDSTSGTVVRTQAYRLRRKLTEYYNAEGASDPILIELPKGHYVPAFSVREPNPRTEVASQAPAERFPWKSFTAAVALFFVGLALGMMLVSVPGPTASPQTSPEILARFWGSFTSESRPVIIAFTNPVYLASEEGDLYQPRGISSGLRGEQVPAERLRSLAGLSSSRYFFEDGFTGTGEVYAMQRLTSLLERLRIRMIAKRNRTVTVEDLRNHDVLFLGSGIAVQSMQNTKLLRRFQIQHVPGASGPWRSRIVDLQSEPGKPASFQVERDASTGVLQTDYAVFAVLPGVVPSSRVIMIAGLSTSGTHGAADFATSEHHMQGLLQSLVGKSKDATALPRYFESVLRVDVARGIDAVNTSIVEASPIGSQF